MDRRDENLDRTVSGRTTDADDRNVGGRLVGEGVGGVSGAAAGAAIGSLGGPIGTLIGGLAGVVGGWWAGREIADAAAGYTDVDDSFYRSHYESSSARVAGRSYDDVRPAYQLGHIASRNPDYANRNFDAVESDLQRGWTDDFRGKYGEWNSVRGYARDAYERGRSGAGAAGATLGDAARDTGAGARNVGHDVADASRRGANKVIDAVDNVKDRIDGNPASKPGPDATDRRL